MALEIYNALGQIDIAAIDPAEVAKLDTRAAEALAALVPTVIAREAAQARYTAAVRAQRDATVEQTAALEAWTAIAKPQTFTEAQQAVISASGVAPNPAGIDPITGHPLA